MELAIVMKQTSFQEEKQEGSMTPDHSSNCNKDKPIRKLKKDNLKEKKKVRTADKSLILEKDQVNQHRLLKNKSDQDNSATTHDCTAHPTKGIVSSSNSKQTTNLAAIVNKPPYVTITNNNKISGDFGHSSAIFKRPIIEGVYCIELLVRQDCKKEKKVEQKSAVRVGICHHAFNYIFPLGCQQSVAYKSIDGSVVRNGEKIGEAQPYTHGDIIGMLIRISPPHKTSNPKEINVGSTISFFKNGKLVFELRELKQVFYCFGVSLFNYSQVEVLSSSKCKYQMSQDAKHYFNALNEQILYQDLKNNKIFKI